MSNKVWILVGIGLILPLIPLGTMIYLILTSAGGGSSAISSGGGTSMLEVANLPPEVLRWKPDVERIAGEMGMSQYVNVLLAIMAQESGGRILPDLMQASEAKCGSVSDAGCIATPQDSIRAGIKAFKSRLQLVDPQLLQKPYTEVKNGENKLKIAIQAYNFGPGFISFAKKAQGVFQTFSQALAEAFSKLQTLKLGWGCSNWQTFPFCYGDTKYVSRVMKYLTPVVAGDGSPLGKEAFQKLYSVMSRYVPGKMTYRMIGPFDPTVGSGWFDCSSFVMYVYRQIGINLPRTAAAQFHSNQVQEIPPGQEKPGDLVVFSTYMSGVSHIGVVINPSTNTMFHCGSSEGSCVSESNYNSPYWDGLAARNGHGASEFPKFGRLVAKPQ